MNKISYSFAIADGDLSLQGDRLDLVFGVDKLKQDLDCWIKERYGGDRFHLNFGSVLQDFIGGVIGDSTRAEVQSEILRVLQNYQSVQHRQLTEDPTLLSASEMLIAIADIKTTVSYDSVNVAVKVINGSDQVTTVVAAAGT